MLAELAAKYGMKVLGVLLLIVIVVGGYYYIRHQGAVAQAKEDAQVLAERNAKEKADSDAQWAEALSRLANARQVDNTNYSKDLQNYAKISADSATALERLRKQPRVSTPESSRAAASRTAYVSGDCPGRTGSSGSEISEAERIEIAKMADLALLATAHIRRTSNVR